jgi:transposase-like protein
MMSYLAKPDTQPHFDGSDMRVMHDMFRREFALMAGLVGGVAAADHDRAQIIGDHMDVVMAILHGHHTREDENIWLLLLDRCTQAARLVGLTEDQHQQVATLLRQVQEELRMQFTSWAFTDRAKRSGLVPSMGSIGDCYDNAMIESFWGRMQTELLNRKRWKTRIELANAIFDYLEIFHNRQRRHSDRVRTATSIHPARGLKPSTATPLEPGHITPILGKVGVMSGGSSRRYPPELRERAVRMVAEISDEHGSEWAAISEVARLLGVGCAETVRKWVRQAQVDSGSRVGTTTEESAELKRLKRENAELRRANSILKTASAFFAAELDRPQH